MKLRIEGFNDEITSFVAEIKKSKKIRVRSVSKPYLNRGSEETRVYVDADVLSMIGWQEIEA